MSHPNFFNLFRENVNRVLIDVSDEKEKIAYTARLINGWISQTFRCSHQIVFIGLESSFVEQISSQIDETLCTSTELFAVSLENYNKQIHMVKAHNVTITLSKEKLKQNWSQCKRIVFSPPWDVSTLDAVVFHQPENPSQIKSYIREMSSQDPDDYDAKYTSAQDLAFKEYPINDWMEKSNTVVIIKYNPSHVLASMFVE